MKHTMIVGFMIGCYIAILIVNGKVAVLKERLDAIAPVATGTVATK